ncbi:LCP family protein [Priestia abyssalis]|uniref:LCP family protein n=1 Tax=Priestia abyssalis TaxID=1221450 RepID=UPI0009949B53|nr:LCP family protein [Priestia abyssalis]
MSDYRRYQKKVNKRKRRRRLFFLFILPVLIIGLSATAYGSYLFAKAKSVVTDSFEEVGNRDTSPMRNEKIDPKKDNISVLFIGIDESEMRKKNYSGYKGGVTRTDALILATLNEKDKSVKLVSIPRDSYVELACGNKKTRINAAHVEGGTLCTIETVENLLDVPVDYYVKVNFNAFIEVVDSLGGIKFDVPYDLKEKDSQDRRNAIVLKEGVQTLNGEEALAIARTRKYDSDIERGKRQQQLIQAIVKEAASMGSITKYGDIIEAVGDNMKTNMKFGEMLSFYDYATHGSNVKIDTLSLKGEDYQPGSAYYYKLHEESIEEVSELLKSHLKMPGSTPLEELEAKMEESESTTKKNVEKN